eukprot:5456683-Prymnesium_polylepis.1
MRTSATTTGVVPTRVRAHARVARAPHARTATSEKASRWASLGASRREMMVRRRSRTSRHSFSAAPPSSRSSRSDTASIAPSKQLRGGACAQRAAATARG